MPPAGAASPPAAPVHVDHKEASPAVPAVPSEDTCAENLVCTSDADCTSVADAGAKKYECDLGCCRINYGEKATQESPVTRSGHEFLTTDSAALADSKMPFIGPGDVQQIKSVGGCSTDHCRHGAHRFGVWSAVMGVRWADLMGFRAGPLFPAQQACLSAVAQDNEDVQYDHALRRLVDKDEAGGIEAIKGIRARLERRFIEAVVADDSNIRIADGGGQQDHYTVSNAHFLFGRALHIVQDSFSTFHGTRTAPGFQAITQVNSYVCTAGAPQHPHVTPGVLNLVVKDKGEANGDVIWLKDCSPETHACLKPEYVAAVEASRDLWIAFRTAHALQQADREAAARTQLNAFLKKWFAVPTKLAAAAPTTCIPPSMPAIERLRLACLGQTTTSTTEQTPPFDWVRKRFTGLKP